MEKTVVSFRMMSSRFLVMGLLLYGCLWNNNKLLATHVMGTEVSYECINGSNDSFMVHLAIVRDCRGVAMNMSNPFPEELQFTDQDGNQLSNHYQVYPLGQNGTCLDITPTCNGQCNSCGLGGVCNNEDYAGASPSNCNLNFGYEKFEFQYLVVFNNALEKCKLTGAFYAGGPFRSNSINTGCGRQSYYTDFQINRCLTPCNSSPKFQHHPEVAVCQNTLVQYSHQAVDDDRDANGNFLDSISYELVPPMTGKNVPCPWIGGYNYESPLHFLGFNPNQPNPNLTQPQGFHLDESSGNMVFQPRSVQSTVIAVQVNEYRNGEKIGHTKRDMQLMVISCPQNEPPKVSGFNGETPNFNTTAICVGDTHTFFFTTADPDTPNSQDPTVFDSVKMAFNKGNLPDNVAWWIEDEGRYEQFPKLILQWAPTPQQVSDKAYRFSISVEDNACPIKATSQQEFQIQVKPKPELEVATSDEGCGQVLWDLSMHHFPDNDSVLSFLWEIQDTVFTTTRSQFIQNFETSGSFPFSVQTLLPECNAEFKDTIAVSSFLKAAIMASDSNICEGEELNLNVHHNREDEEVEVNWDDGSSQKERTVFGLSEDKTFIAKVQDGECHVDVQFQVKVRKLPEISLGEHIRICDGVSTFLFNSRIAGSISDEVEKPYFWKKPHSAAYFTADSSVLVSPEDTGWVIGGLKTNEGCLAKDSVWVTQNEIVNFIRAEKDTICHGEDLLLSSSFRGVEGSVFEWYERSEDTLIFIGNSSQILVSPNQKTRYLLFLKYEEKCIDIDSIDLNVIEEPDIYFNRELSLCQALGSISLAAFLNSHNQEDFHISWNSIDFPQEAIDSNRLHLQYFSQKGGTFHLAVSYRKKGGKCQFTDTLAFEVFSQPDITHNLSKNICETEGEISLEAYPKGGIWMGEGVKERWDTAWLLDLSSPELEKEALNKLQYFYIDSNGCENTFNLSYYLNRFYPITPLFDTAVCAGTLFQLIGEPKGGEWFQRQNGESIPLKDSLLLVEKDQKALNLVYELTNGACKDIDSLEVKVLPNPKLQILTVQEGVFCNTLDTVWLKTNLDTLVSVKAIEWEAQELPESVAENIFMPSQFTHGGDELIRAKVTFQNGCSNVDSIRWQVKAAPQLKPFTDTNLFCQNNADEVELSGVVMHSDEKVSWTIVNGFGNLENLSALTSKYYFHQQDFEDERKVIFQAKITDKECGTIADTVSIKLAKNPEAAFDLEKDGGCVPFHLKVYNQTNFYHRDANGNGEQRWKLNHNLLGDYFEPDLILKDTGEHDLNLWVVNDAGCEDSISRSIEVGLMPNAAFGFSPSFIGALDPIATFSAKNTNNQFEYQWRIDDDSISDISKFQYDFGDTGSYAVQLIITNNLGCSDSFTRIVKVLPDANVFIPNSFTPNGDGHNDAFKVEATNLKAFTFTVYNRWGEMVYHTDDYESHQANPWKGIYNGEPLAEGVYVYKLKAKDVLGKQLSYSGTIQLLRP